MMKRTLIVVGTVALTLMSSAAVAAQCGKNANGFNAFKKDFSAYAQKKGVGKRGIAALQGTQYSSATIKFDRVQRKSFKKGFDAFYKLRTTGLKKPSLAKLKKHAGVFANVEKRFGVPKEVLVTIWGMETAFGRFSGKHDVITSLATLTHDCRRSDFFRPHLLGALQILDNGWMPRSQMRGARHGEIGQTQFLPGNYVAFSVDFDGDGRRNLVSSVPDVLASTANFLKRKGWKAGGSYQPGSHNYNVLKTWNAATVYQKSIAKFAATL
ncbi:MAG: lytic murein transglycosylase [Hyphomicrobiales bacterium]